MTGPVLGGQISDTDERDHEIARMKTKIGDITMENELLRERAVLFEEGGLSNAIEFFDGLDDRGACLQISEGHRDAHAPTRGRAGLPEC